MAERELAILLTAKNLASGAIKKVRGDISSLDSVSARAGKGVRTLGSNLKTLGTGLAIGGAIAGVAAIRSGLESLAERENVISATTAAIAAQGASANVTAGQVRNWSEELERATGAAVDDKAIQASANTIIRTGAVSEAAFKRTLAAAVDLGAGLKTGPEAGAKLLGKALADPVKGITALRKAGIVLNEAEQKRIKDLVKGNKVQAAQAEILAAVEKRYKGAAEASAGPYTRALNMLADVTEDAKMALAEGFLPVLTKVADKLSGALGDEKTMADIRGLGQGLAKGFDAVLDASSRIPWGSIRDAMSLAGQGAKAALDLFTGMPPWVQTAVLTGWGLNKLTGGAIGGIVGELGKGLIKGVLGMNAGVVNINAGAVRGGVPGVGGAGAAGGGLGLASKVFLVGEAIGLALLVNEVRNGISEGNTTFAKTLSQQNREWLAQNPSRTALEGGLAATERGILDIARTDPQGLTTGESLAELKAIRAAILAQLARDRNPPVASQIGVDARQRHQRSGLEAAVLQRATAAGLKPSADQITRTANATAARQTAAAARQEAASRAVVSAALNEQRANERGFASVVAAIKGISIPQPVINFTAADTVRKINRRQRTVRPVGTRDRILGGMQEF